MFLKPNFYAPENYVGNIYIAISCALLVCQLMVSLALMSVQSVSLSPYKPKHPSNSIYMNKQGAGEESIKRHTQREYLTVFHKH